MATSYSILKIKDKLVNKTIKDIFGINEIQIEKKGDYDNFILFECKIKKEITDEIFIYTNNNIQSISNYFKIYLLDLFYFGDDNIAIIRGKYEARELLIKLLLKDDKEIKEFFKFNNFCKIDLKNILDRVNEMRTISIKDLTATINKIKATGNLDKENEIIKQFIEQGSEITALTIEYPCNNETITIHIKSDCSLRVSNCDILSSIENEANFIYKIYKFIRGENE